MKFHWKLEDQRVITRKKDFGDKLVGMYIGRKKPDYVMIKKHSIDGYIKGLEEEERVHKLRLYMTTALKTLKHPNLDNIFISQ